MIKEGKINKTLSRCNDISTADKQNRLVPADVPAVTADTRQHKGASAFWTVQPNSAASEAIVLLFDGHWQFILCQLLQELLDAVFLELGSARVSNQDFGAVGFNTEI